MTRYAAIECAGPGCTAAVTLVTSIVDAEHFARLEGWQLDGGRALCPDCWMARR